MKVRKRLLSMVLLIELAQVVLNPRELSHHFEMLSAHYIEIERREKPPRP